MVFSVIIFLPIYEIFLRRVFRKFHHTRFYRSLFPLAATAILVLSIFTALQAHDKNAAFQMASRGFDFMRTAVLVFFIGLMLLMGRQWARVDLGITLGFAIQAAVALANSALRASIHYRPSAMDVVEGISYNVSCVIWLITFWRPEKKQAPPDQINPEMLDQARAWEAALKDWLAPSRNKH